MSEHAAGFQQAKNARQLSSGIRAEFPLLIGLVTVVIFFAAGSQLVEMIAHPARLIGVFIWLFAVILWSAMCVVRHAECLAVKLGEPYGTLILTLSAISIEVVMIALNGFAGLCLVIGGLRYREQYYNLQGVNSYLNVIMTLAVLGLVLPNFTTSTSGPTFSTEQAIFLIVMSLLLYAIFLLIQTMRHRRYFVEYRETVSAANSAHHPLQTYSTGFHATMLLLYMVTVILLAKKFAIPLDNSIERFGMPQAFGGAIIAALVLAPEGIGAIDATLRNQLQRSINILFGSVLATIGLTISAVLTIGLSTRQSV